jgi:hypothetical protein
VLRSVVAASWQRATEQGVDPDGAAPLVLGRVDTRRALERNRVFPHLGTIKGVLGSATVDASCFAVLSDAKGMLLWAEGDSEALTAARDPGFLPGHLCSESAVGTNAVGTSIRTGAPVQIFSAEHFNRRLHGLMCSAAPIRDPGSGEVVAAINVSGDFRSGHPHTLSLVSAVARIVEDQIAREEHAVHAQLREQYIAFLGDASFNYSALVLGAGRVLASSPAGWLGSQVRVGSDRVLGLPSGVERVRTFSAGGIEAVVVAGSERAGAPTEARLAVRLAGPCLAVTVGEFTTRLSRRHSQIVASLILHRDGISAAELGSRTYGLKFKPGTLRAELTRLRRILGPIVTAEPYHLDARIINQTRATEAARAIVENSSLELLHSGAIATKRPSTST